MSSPVSRLRVLLVAVVVSLGSLALVSSAFAGDAVPGGKVCPPGATAPGCGLGSVWDPNTTNIPYLGVAGEQVRVVKCGDYPAGAIPEFLPEAVDWSNDNPNRPQLVTNSVHTLFASGGPSEGATCFAAEYISDKPGLAFIKLKVFSAGPGPEIDEHQFLVGWTRICGNTLTEVASPELGDPTGNGVFNARSGFEDPITRGFGRLSNQVKLCLPMGSNFAGLFPGDNVTLPDDWVALANQFARDVTPSRADDPRRWDIHDSQLSTDDIHVDNNTINPTTGTATCDGPNDPNTGQPLFVPFVGPDTVDNCLAPNAFTTPTTISPVSACDVPGLTPTAGEVGSFSRVFGDLTTCPTVGPFDPNRPDETLLSDGRLDAGDAPLPAVRIDFEIAAPSGVGIDGVGILCGPGSFGTFTGIGCTGVDKHVVRSRNQLAPLAAHNSDSPFYAAYIPATAAPDPPTTGGLPSAASGVSGVNGANNFPAFLNTTNPYHYWDHTFDLTNFPPGGNVSNCNRFFNQRRTGPIGATTVAVYSDEHGEAQAWYDPGGVGGHGFFFDRIPGIVINLDGGCDLQNVGVLGTSSITAIARYPYEPVTLPDIRSNAVTKTVNNLFNKSISCVNKGNIPDVARLCTVTALDINGRPFGNVPGTERNEIVCFSIQDGSSVTIDRGWEAVADPRPGTNRVCGLLDDDGILKFVVLSSVGRPVDVIADFTDQELFRDCFVDFTPGGAGNCIASGGTGGGTTAPPAGTTTGTTTGQTVVIPAHKTSHAKFTVAYTRIVRPVHHRRYLQLRINSKSKKSGRVKIRIRITDRKGRSRTVTRRVRINRAVRLYGLPLTGAKRIKVTVLG